MQLPAARSILQMQSYWRAAQQPVDGWPPVVATWPRVRTALRWRALAIVGALVASMGFAPAQADEGWRLEWQAPATCPAKAQLEARLTDHLGGPPDSVNLQVEGSITRAGERWQLDLEARRGQAFQHRTLRHSDCAVLTEAAAVLVALAIDPASATIDRSLATLLKTATTTTGEKPGDPSTPPEQPKPPPTEPAPEASEAPAPVAVAASPPEKSVPAPKLEPNTPTPKRRVFAALRLNGGIAYGLRTQVNGGLYGTVAVGLGKLARVEAAGSYWRLNSGAESSQQGAGANVFLGSGMLRGCVVPGRKWLEVPVCGGIELGSIRAVGPGIPESRQGGQLWSAVVIGPALAFVPIPQLAIWLATDGHIALTRPSFRIAPTGEMWRAGGFDFRATLGLEVRFRKSRR